MQYPKITIITPSFNQGQFIEKTIQSILDQEYPNLEYIIIDGGSKDNTVGIIKKYEKQLSYWISEQDKGQSHAINKGLNIATGEIFNWINSDDYLEPGALWHIAELFINNSGVNAIGGYCRLFSEDSKKFSIISRIGVNDNLEASIVNFQMNQPSTFYRMDVIRRFGGVNQTLHYCMDLELWFRFLCQYDITGIKLTPNLLSHFRHHHESKTENVNEKFILENNFLIHYLIKELDLPIFLTDEFNKAINYYEPASPWNLSKVSKKNISIQLALKHHHSFYQNRNFKALRWALLTLFFGGKIRLNRYFLSLTLKAITNK